ncbi:helix-turn-helix domain-containing protein [Butyrivibrio sp. NC3005]|uniref:helix-turn-helix domain-containing protein n=1 Tax=Butyrivibrio sp. NC3005 TaxID=1280685 RepID=UPI000427FE24|nr:AraC family transcriptional regulator [Butyrivibrio sp. NC3005]
MKSDLNLNMNAKEIVYHKVGTNLRVFVNRLHSDFPPHWHTDIEIIKPIDAPYKVICSNQTYTVDIGDILLICPAVLHEIFSIAPGSRLYIQADFSGIITLKELEQAFRLMSPALLIKKKSCPKKIYEQLCTYIDMISKLYFGPSISAPEEIELDDAIIAYTELAPYEELEIYSNLMLFISLCGKNLNLFHNSQKKEPYSVFKNHVSLSNVCSYISDHFTQDISLERISAYAGFSKYHFERIFNEYTGMSFYQYLQQMRIGYAQTLLSNPELSITDISYQAGFSSCIAFTRAFKKSTGYTPSQYRMLNEVQHSLPANPHFAKNRVLSS